jgi:hypothetical protein
MGKTKCSICSTKNKEAICHQCGADLSIGAYEQLKLKVSGLIYYSDDEKYNNMPASCKFAFTNRRFVIYRIKPEAYNTSAGFLKSRNARIKASYISINLNDIKEIKRYGKKYSIQLETDSYFIEVSKHEEIDKLFSPYKGVNN